MIIGCRACGTFERLDFRPGGVPTPITCGVCGGPREDLSSVSDVAGDVAAELAAARRTREHERNSPSCWCGPRLERACYICAGEIPTYSALPCWKCDGKRWVEADPSDSGILIIHNNDAEVGMQLNKPGAPGPGRWPPREGLEGPAAEEPSGPWWMNPWVTVAVVVILLVVAVALAVW